MISNRHYHLLLLASVPGVGHNRIRALLRKFGHAEQVFAASLQALTATEGLDQGMAKRILDPAKRDVKFVESQIKWMGEYDARLVTFLDSDYPENLREIYDAPAYFFQRGSIIESDRNAIAIVGTRECTSYGRLMAEILAKELVARGITIVSGLARGIDTAAHESALRNGGRNIAVLGSGVDRIYPSENFKLAMGIIENGAVVSDYPMHTGPDAVNFPGRNRIISGLSLGTVIVEAGEKSGALITADFALEQNREVFAVPGQVNVPQAKGPNRLIRQGAKLVETVDDILCEVEARLMGTSIPRKPEARLELSEIERKIYEQIQHEPVHVDILSKHNHIPVHETLTHLLNLELLGAVRQVSGKQFVKL